MDASVMVGRGTGGAAVLFILTIGILLSARSSRAQKGDGCGHTVFGRGSGSVSSLGYPQWLCSTCVCEWEITVDAKHTVLLHVADLNIQPHDCQITYLRIYNGIGPHRSELVKLCGKNLEIPDLIHSHGNQVTIQFMSGPHSNGRGFFLSYSTNEHPDVISCLDRGVNFTDAEFSKFCPAGCLTGFGEVSGTVPHGYRDSSVLCLAGIHAGVVSDVEGGQINVVSSKGIPHYDSTLANNVTSVIGALSPSLFTFKTSGCYGTLGLESGVIRDTQLSASSVWVWYHGNSLGSENDIGAAQQQWGATGARLKRAGLPWAAAHADQQQWIQVDLKREKKITGIITTGSTLQDYQFYVSAYRVLYRLDGQDWTTYQEANTKQEKVFQGNTNYFQEVRNNFIPPIRARYMRISPSQWHQRITLKLELLGCQLPVSPPVHSTTQPPSKLSTRRPLLELSTHTPEIRNNTLPPHTGDVAMAAVLVPVLVMLLTALLLTAVCSWHWKNRKNPEVTYELPHWDRTVWWKSMKQLLPSKLSEGEECVRYSSSGQVGRLRANQRIHTEPAEYAQPLVGGVMTSLGVRSTFKPEEGEEPPYDSPLTPDLLCHAYAEPLPASGVEYATPIVIDMANHQSGGPMGFAGRALLARTESGQSASSLYDTPKTTPGQATPSAGQAYQVPQNSSQNASGVS
ncbi:discoidin, CUB and LCCL domain-containing protein 2 [Clupea harengus]|uniref:Discoidin, CUB and LCCL domain-containing protein 2 n=1 Tax=Clupea harengus TaxID=7950 RepID=A0A6P8GNB7_CLUHA|nr:discoidin, CUB and LCCL domain-containing protein 2 [Clupea harengus]